MLILDCEVYSNYFSIGFLNINTQAAKHFELYDGATGFNRKAILALMQKNTTISFNGLSYDLLLISAALSGADNALLKRISDTIIHTKRQPWQIVKEFNLQTHEWDHIDLINIAPGQSSLKIYGGRLNAPRMQDLPIEPSATITPDLRSTMREYCENDLRTTEMLYSALGPQIKLREQMSEQYGMDLRSKSDAQIAETIIISELSRITGKEYKKPTVKDGQTFRYIDPKIVKFKNPSLKVVFAKLLKQEFELGANGTVKLPEWLSGRIAIGASEYQMGIGGLHSCEKSQYVKAEGEMRLGDFDVAGFYPAIILQQKLAPSSMGEDFLRVYQGIVTRRMEAKRSGNMVVSDVLKIAVNGSFGKLGSKYSPLYAPDLLIQTTITGQLCLLMLIERIEAAGGEVVSANTDGVVVYYNASIESKLEHTLWDWMLDTSFELERTDYKLIASRDVNSYCAVRTDGKIKGKGCFASTGLSKNPDSPIIYTAVMRYLATGTPIAETIRDCRDITQFVTLRKVTGGATWRGSYLGKAVRFYSSTEVPSDVCIHYAKNSNRVPNSAGCKPLMDLPEVLPDDVDYHHYEVESEKLLCEVGV